MEYTSRYRLKDIDSTRLTLVQEGQTGVIDLPFDDPAVVKALLQYLYTFDYNVPEHLEETIAYAQARAMQSKAPASDKPPAAEDSNNGPSPEEPSIETTIEAAPDGYGSYGGDVDLTGSSVEASALGIGSYRPESHSDYLWRMYHRSQHLRPRAEDEQEPRQPQTEGEASTSAPDAPEPEYDERALPPMLFHINVYALADRVQNKPLKTLAETKFEALAKKEWKSPDFPSAIEAIYSVAPPGSTGDSLRKMIVRLVVSHAKELFNLDRGFTSMLQDTPDFAADLARALSGAGISAKGAELNIDVEELCCPGCKFIMKAAIAQSVTMLTCPICRWEGIVSRWRHGQKEQGTLKKGRRSVLTSSWEL